jgi:hypothetical protein
VHVSDEPLRFWNPDRRDSAEISKSEMFAEFRRIAKPGQYDSVGYYFLPRDPEIFLHEWMHGLEQFYNGKPGVRLPSKTGHGLPEDNEFGVKARFARSRRVGLKHEVSNRREAVSISFSVGWHGQCHWLVCTVHL